MKTNTEQKRVKNIRAIAKRMARYIPNMVELADVAISKGTLVEAFRANLFRKIPEVPIQEAVAAFWDRQKHGAVKKILQLHGCKKGKFTGKMWIDCKLRALVKDGRSKRILEATMIVGISKSLHSAHWCVYPLNSWKGK